MSLDPNKLMALMGKLVGDLGAMMSIGPMIVGEKLGLYKAMADGALLDAAELAAKTGTHERYVHEWLCAQAASGYVEYDPAADRFRMTEEQTAALGAEAGPFTFWAQSSWPWPWSRTNPKSYRPSGREKVSAGTSMTNVSFEGPSGSFVPATCGIF